MESFLRISPTHCTYSACSAYGAHGANTWAKMQDAEPVGAQLKNQNPIYTPCSVEPSPRAGVATINVWNPN